MSLSSRLLAATYDRLTRPSEEACMTRWRSELLEPLAGVVLDVGAGTGANLAHYGAGIDRVVAAEPDRHMRRRLVRRASNHSRIEISDASLEHLPMSNASFDAVVATLVLCTVPDPGAALAEIKRVLKPGGVLVFIEHVASTTNDGRLRWQRRIEPVWKRVFAGCHLTRDSEGAMRHAGFDIEAIERESMRKAAPVVRPTIRGVARHV